LRLIAIAYSSLRIILNEFNVSGAGAYACFRPINGLGVQDDAKLKVYLRHRAALVEYAIPIVGDRTSAEDVVQEAYLRFAPPSDSQSVMRTVEHPTAYLYRIVRNLAYDLRRSLSADRRRDRAHLAYAEGQPLALSPEDQTVDRDELRRVAKILAELPPNTRRAFEMHRIGGYTLQEIANHLGVSLATVGRWTQDAIKHVVRRMERPDRE
jgi:RNA polymerase sigma-70 factor (ECF subfamily)